MPPNLADMISGEQRVDDMGAIGIVVPGSRSTTVTMRTTLCNRTQQVGTW